MGWLKFESIPRNGRAAFHRLCQLTSTMKTYLSSSAVRTVDAIDPRLIDRLFLGCVAIAAAASLVLALLG